MNQEEEKIRKMFRQLKAEDEQNAPSFTSDWNTALSRMNTPRRRWVVWQMSAGVAALLILLGTGWWMFFRQSTMEIAPVEIVRLAPVETVRSETFEHDTTTQVSPLSGPDAAPPVSPSQSRVKNRPTTARQRSSVQSQPPPILISQWRSPTESLLRTPGEQLFKRVPRLNDSVVNIKATISNQKN